MPKNATLKDPVVEIQNDNVVQRAVLFIHGIGEQRRFEQMVDFVNGLLEKGVPAPYLREGAGLTGDLKKIFQDPSGKSREMFQDEPVEIGKDLKLGVETYKDEGHFDARITLSLPPKPAEDNVPERDKTVKVDIYEVYWAPITAGKTNFMRMLMWIMSTMPLLFRGAPALKDPKVKWNNYLIEILRFILVFIAAVIVLGLGYLLCENLLEKILSFQIDFWINYDIYRFLATVIGFLLSCVVVYDLVGFTLGGNISRLISIICVNIFFIYVLLLIGYSGLIPVLLIYILFLFLVLILKKFLVGFLGDVAIYVSDFEVREDINVRREIIKKTLRQLGYLVRRKKLLKNGEDSEEFFYDDIVIVAHSLGSAVAYDALNRALFHDGEKHNGTEDARKRIKQLYTVGSPLEKIWYYWRDRSHISDPIYQGILADLKGIVDKNNENSQFHHVSWDNIWCFTDVVSSSLHRYGEVVNHHDWPTLLKQPPLLNHLNYWKSASVMKMIGDRVFHIKPHG